MDSSAPKSRRGSAASEAELGADAGTSTNSLFPALRSSVARPVTSSTGKTTISASQCFRPSGLDFSSTLGPPLHEEMGINSGDLTVIEPTKVEMPALIFRADEIFQKVFETGINKL